MKERDTVRNYKGVGLQRYYTEKRLINKNDINKTNPNKTITHTHNVETKQQK